MNTNLITHPAHYVQGRTIQPIDVIDHWSLCHHLACVVKYIARAGRKNPILEDLRKADWYLTRELSRYQKDFNKCQLALIEPQPFLIDAVREDWQLSENLGESLAHIRGAKTEARKGEALQRAQKYLKAEINRYEQKENRHDH